MKKLFSLFDGYRTFYATGDKRYRIDIDHYSDGDCEAKAEEYIDGHWHSIFHVRVPGSVVIEEGKEPPPHGDDDARRICLEYLIMFHDGE